MKLTTLDKMIPQKHPLMFVDSETGCEIMADEWDNWEVESIIVNVKPKEER